MDEANMCAQIKVNTEKVHQVEKRQDKLEVIIDKIRNRPPLWCTFALGGFLGAIGWLVGK